MGRTCDLSFIVSLKGSALGHASHATRLISIFKADELSEPNVSAANKQRRMLGPPGPNE